MGAGYPEHWGLVSLASGDELIVLNFKLKTLNSKKDAEAGAQMDVWDVVGGVSRLRGNP